MGYRLGVDLGTTYTAAAIVQDGRAQIVSIGTRGPVVPSVLFLREDNEILTGEAANRRAVTEPGRVAREFKRRMGDPTPMLLGGSPMSPQALMAKLLRWTVDQVAQQEGSPPEHVAVSHPANWGPFKLDLLQQAVRLADLESCTTLTEPEAAAIYYASTERVQPGDTIAVYDLGGGTFDAAVLRKSDTGFEILGTPEGIEHLGGIDVDEAVFAHVLSKLGSAIDDLDPDAPGTIAAVTRLRYDCIEAKEALSSDTEATIAVMLPTVQQEVTITRDELEAMVRPWLGDTVAALRRALRSAGVEPADLHAVLLVGGASRMPLVATLVSEELGRPVAVDAHPKHAVALGAALAADQASGPPQVRPAAPVTVMTPPPTPMAADMRGDALLIAGVAGVAGVAGAAGLAAAGEGGEGDAGAAAASAGEEDDEDRDKGGAVLAAGVAGGVGLVGTAGAVAAGGLGDAAAASTGTLAAGAGPLGTPLTAGPAGAPVTVGPGGTPITTGPGGSPLAPTEPVPTQPAPGGPSGPGGGKGGPAKKVARKLPRKAIIGGAVAGVAIAAGAAALIAGGGGKSEVSTNTTVAVSSSTSSTASSSTAASPPTSIGTSQRGLDGIVSLVAGDGTDSGQGRPGPADQASLGNTPYFATAPNGDIFVINHENEVVLIHDGQMSTIYKGNSAIGESGFGGVAIGPDGLAYVTMGRYIRKVAADGSSQLVMDSTAEGIGSSLGAITVDGTGNIYFFHNNTYRVLRRGTDGSLSQVAGTGQQGRIAQPPQGDGGPALSSPLAVVTDLLVDPQGNLLIADSGTGSIRKVASNGTITTIAGGGTKPLNLNGGTFAPEGTLVTDLKLASANAVAIDGKGRTYVADASDHILFRFGSDGKLELVIADQGGTTQEMGHPANQTRGTNTYDLAMLTNDDLQFIQNNKILSIEGAGK